MAKLLLIQAHPKTNQFSYSLEVAKHFMNTYQQEHPTDIITVRDVFTDEVPPINDLTLDAWLKVKKADTHTLSSEQQHLIDKHDTWLEEFINHDKYVFVNPMYNHFIPAEMKQYIDLVSVARKTFKYTENGLVGLLKGKKSLHIQAAGGYYQPDIKVDLGSQYLNDTMLRFGVTPIESIYIEGMSETPEKATDILNAAISKATTLAATF
ncbi:MAG: NAD(P)H-dependent oxidoreductase [Vagococcus sp.]|uniref:NAD(P)H-dependent oxidoreductase n=1 Tax=Vagococcus sp. TaxID=1933889 RepID=UPI002FCA26BC